MANKYPSAELETCILICGFIIIRDHGQLCCDGQGVSQGPPTTPCSAHPLCPSTICRPSILPCTKKPDDFTGHLDRSSGRTMTRTSWRRQLPFLSLGERQEGRLFWRLPKHKSFCKWQFSLLANLLGAERSTHSKTLTILTDTQFLSRTNEKTEWRSCGFL